MGKSLLRWAFNANRTKDEFFRDACHSGLDASHRHSPEVGPRSRSSPFREVAELRRVSVVRCGVSGRSEIRRTPRDETKKSRAFGRASRRVGERAPRRVLPFRHASRPWGAGLRCGLEVRAWAVGLGCRRGRCGRGCERGAALDGAGRVGSGPRCGPSAEA